MATFVRPAFRSILLKVHFQQLIVKESRSFHRYVPPTIRAINKRKTEAEPLPVEKTKRSSWIEWNHSAEIFAFGKRLGEEFKIELLWQAFIDRSYVVREELKQQEVGIENPGLSMKDNRTLAEEGEKIISNELTRFLSGSLPRLPQEFVRSIHDYLISEETLAEISTNLGSKDIIFTAEYPPDTATLARTLKAVVGALAQSQSVEVANKFVVDIIATKLAGRDLNELYSIENPMQLLTDVLTRDQREPPEPRIIGQSAMNEILASYTVGMYSDKQFIGKGHGETVACAVEMAAWDALMRLFNTTENAAPLKFTNTYSEKEPSNLRLSAWKASAFT